MKTIRAAAFFVLIAGGVGLSAQSAPSTPTIDLGRGSGLIVSYCSPCHDWAQDYDSIMASGLIVPGKSASSQAWYMISTDQMPASGPAPSAEEKKLIKDWIDAGAPAPKK